jgi:hypothetical protein
MQGTHQLFQDRPAFVQLTKDGVGRLPGAEEGLVFDVDCVAPSTTYPGLWSVFVRDYRFPVGAGMLGRPYHIWVLRPGDYEPL